MTSVAKSIANYILARPKLAARVKPMAHKYLDLAGYRKMGLVYDDMIHEENEIVAKALSRLPAKLKYDRVFRQRRAIQCSLSHSILPESEQTKPEEDIAYLRPYIEEVEMEIQERKEFDALRKTS